MKRANVGDYVKVIKKISCYNNVAVGDIGIVNYVSDSGKYSVHINGKKNPKETHSRLFGQKDNFWIPFDSCEIVTDTIGVIDNDVLYKCLFNNADAYTATWDDIPDDIKELVEIGFFTKEEILGKCSNNLNQEREVTKVKEIRNQKVVDLYFQKKLDSINEEYKKKYDAIKEEDKHYQFIVSIQKQLDDYVEKNEDLKNAKYDKQKFFSMTEESSQKIEQLNATYNKQTKDLASKKEEVLAMLSGCERYEQEMDILKAYNIVDSNNLMLSGE